MNQNNEEPELEETPSLITTEKPKETIRKEIKKYIVLSEDKREIRLGLRYIEV